MPSMTGSRPLFRGVRRLTRSGRQLILLVALAIALGVIIGHRAAAGTLFDPLMLFLLIAAVSALTFLMIPEYAGLLNVMG